MKTAFIFICVSLLLLTSCSFVQKEVVEVSRQDVKNAETIREVSKNFLSTWPVNSGFIKGILKGQFDQFPKEMIEAMEELDQLSQKKDLDDFQLGYSLGLRVHVLSDIVKESLKKIAPQILKYLSL